MGNCSLLSIGTPIYTGHCPAPEDSMASAEVLWIRSDGFEMGTLDLVQGWEENHPAQGMAGSTQPGTFCLKAEANWSQIRLSKDKLQERGDRTARRRGPGWRGLGAHGGVCTLSWKLWGTKWQGQADIFTTIREPHLQRGRKPGTQSVREEPTAATFQTRG